MKIVLLQAGEPVGELDLSAGAYTIGRSEDCIIVIDDPSLAETHAEIFEEDARAYIKPIDGITMVNGTAAADCVPLGDGDQLGLGALEVSVSVPDPAIRDPAAPSVSRDPPCASVTSDATETPADKVRRRFWTRRRTTVVSAAAILGVLSLATIVVVTNRDKGTSSTPAYVGYWANVEDRAFVHFADGTSCTTWMTDRPVEWECTDIGEGNLFVYAGETVRTWPYSVSEDTLQLNGSEYTRLSRSEFEKALEAALAVPFDEWGEDELVRQAKEMVVQSRPQSPQASAGDVEAFLEGYLDAWCKLSRNPPRGYSVTDPVSVYCANHKVAPVQPSYGINDFEALRASVINSHAQRQLGFEQSFKFSARVTLRNRAGGSAGTQRISGEFHYSVDSGVGKLIIF